MIVKECFNKFIEILGPKCNVEDGIKYFNLTEYDMALNYFPLKHEETWSHYPKVYYQEFQHPVSTILNCENKTYKVSPTYILSKDKKPLGKVEYYYLPEEKTSIDDVSDYSSKCLNCIVYGMLSEYHIAQGDYEIASMWANKYKQEIKRLNLLNIDLTKRKDDKPYTLCIMDESEPYQIINHETTAIRRCAENEGKFVDLLNQEMKELTSSLIDKIFLPTIEKEVENARAERDKHINFDREAEEKKDYDKSQFHRKQSIWYDGQFKAYQNMINILKGDK
jgi:hypothetical protein